MARTHNAFAPKTEEASKIETPWGVFNIAPPNKARLEQISQLQKDASVDDIDPVMAAELGLRSIAAGLANGEVFLEKALGAWNAGDLTLGDIRATAEFVGEEIQGVVSAGND